MRIVIYTLFLLTATVTTAAGAPSEKGGVAVHEDGFKSDAVVSLQTQGFGTTQSSAALFEEITRGKSKSEMGRALFTSQLASDNTSGQCLWYKSVTYYTDNTYTTQCGGLMYLCEGLVGSTGPCRTPFYTIQTCECMEETQ
jgi:hypothetical protein